MQHAWLRSARSRLLRRCNLSTSQTILELGCGWGLATMEIAQRTQSAKVIGLDVNAKAIEYAKQQVAPALQKRVEFLSCDATALPLLGQSVDIVFSQCAFLWFQDIDTVLSEVSRVLKPGGWLVTIEPDYGGLMDWPEELSLRSIWLEALIAARAQPLIGRALYATLKRLGWTTEARFLDFYESPREQSVEFLMQLPVNETQLQKVDSIQQQLRKADDNYVAHLPFWMVTARRT
ncbi:MAG: class I SAM-dependent methyltransferase [Pirellulales bacterium]